MKNISDRFATYIIMVISIAIFIFLINVISLEKSLAYACAFGAICVAGFVCNDLKNRIFFYVIIIIYAGLNFVLISAIDIPRFKFAALTMAPIATCDALLLIGVLRLFEKLKLRI